MCTHYFSRSMNRRLASATSPVLLLIFLVLGAILWIAGCNKDTPIAVTTKPPLEVQSGTTGEEFLISVLDEIDNITEYVLRNGNTSQQKMTLNELSSALPTKQRKMVVSSTTIDTTYIYGEVTKDGYCAVVTEKHAYPKGILLITVRKTYGKPPIAIVSETKKFISEQDFLNDTTQQSTISEVYGLSIDTIVTHVQRNGVVETYTFRLPVITSILNPQDGTVRVTKRYGGSGAVYSEVRDGYNNLIQVRITSCGPEGEVITYTEYPDASWRNVKVFGQSDGSILREITSGP
ncbi:MAG: hypothetical protein HZB59_10115 [Ignavibacteriales bacterium]|nr:hypothetical protein [Ignavibacteriales bacterium]